MDAVIYSLGVVFACFLVVAGVVALGKWAFRQCLSIADQQVHDLARDARPCGRGTLRIVK
jgi:hypothetical protein